MYLFCRKQNIVAIGCTPIIRNLLNNRFDIASVVEHFTQNICLTFNEFLSLVFDCVANGR
jgi:hypothetical protein